MAAPEPTTAPDPLAARPQPTLAGLTPGAGAAFHDGPAFDPAEVAAQVAMPPRPQAGAWHTPGAFREPAEPFAPPSWADVPADLAEALAEYDAKRTAWDDAVDAVEEYRDKARQSRAQREATIRAAGQAAARGAKRPAIPSAISEADEETEVRVLSTVVDVRRREADAAARKADRLTMDYAPGWAAEAVERHGPALDEATADAQRAYESAQRAEAVLNQAAFWRSLALAADLKRAGVNVSEHQRHRIMSDLLDASKTRLYRQAEADHRSPADLLNRVHEALGTLRMCDPGVIPAPDTLYMPGDEGVYRDMWRAMFDGASPARKQAFRDRHAGGYPLHHERDR
ncbi:hypothetical protein [Micromonospora sp. NPDC007230]|uniref:hypothetical protein n=1 Tax=Micromonospora sp. NPDC007230 TaxID=3364237 RepID=UPI0036BBC58A